MICIKFIQAFNATSAFNGVLYNKKVTFIVANTEVSPCHVRAILSKLWFWKPDEGSENNCILFCSILELWNTATYACMPPTHAL